MWARIGQWIIQEILTRAASWAVRVYQKYIKKKEREEKQKEAVQKVNQDLQNGQPRSPEEIKNETDMLNS